MKLFHYVKREVSYLLWKKSFKKNYTTMSWKVAPIYQKYLESLRAHSQTQENISSEISKAIADFNENGTTSFWTKDSESIAVSILSKIRNDERIGTAIFGEEGNLQELNLFSRFPELEGVFKGDLDKFLTSVYGAGYKIYYGLLYKSERKKDEPEGSQIWHSDGGPGTCINLMYCLSAISRENGGMECIPWNQSYEIQEKVFKEYDAFQRSLEAKNLNRLQLRSKKSEMLKRHIEKRGISPRFPIGRPGMIYPFRNNLVHKGGFPDPGYERYVIVFHIYPSSKSFDLERYKKNGVPKKGPYPQNPEFDD